MDAGHFPVELDFASYIYDRDKSGAGDKITEALSVAPINLKMGLAKNMDLQVVLETYSHARIQDRVTGTSEVMSGFGDVTTRLKVNLLGNDGGKIAFGMMPFIKIPTNQDGLGNNALEGGVIFPLALDLPWNWGMGVMTEFDFQQDSTGRGYHPSFINSLTLSHQICGKLGGYAELFSEVSAEGGSSWIGTLDFGITYGLTENLQLDAGINIGVTGSADDFNPFAGLSWRF